MTDLNSLTIAAARDALRAGEVTSLDLTDACLAAMDRAGALGAFVHPTPERAREQARAADARIKAGDAPAMCGVPSASRICSAPRACRRRRQSHP